MGASLAAWLFFPGSRLQRYIRRRLQRGVGTFRPKVRIWGACDLGTGRGVRAVDGCASGVCTCRQVQQKPTERRRAACGFGAPVL